MVGKFSAINPSMSPEQAEQRLKELKPNSRQKEVLRALMEGGVSYGTECREINKYGECFTFATIHKIEYERAVEAIVENAIPDQRELAYAVAALAFSKASCHNTAEPEELKGLLALLIE